MAFVFFFSYARANRRNCERASPLGVPTNLLDQLFDDLTDVVHDDLGGEKAKIGYRDVEELKVGDPWHRSLADAVCSARVLVTVFTPGYFESVHCGREFLVFQNRIQEHRNTLGSNTPAPIVPVFWTNESVCRRGPGDSIDRHFRDIQYRQAGMPTRYPGIGCKQLMDLHTQDYRQLVYSLGEAICALETYNLQALQPAPSFHKLASAFAVGAQSAPSERDLSLNRMPAVPAEIAARQPLPLIRPGA